MLFTLSAIVLSSQIALVSEVPPTLDFAVGCRAANQSKQANLQECFKDEAAARTTLAETWLQYPLGDRANCSAVATSGGPQSYVELVTCLQMARDAKKIQKAD
jgi:hypothetical protein